MNKGSCYSARMIFSIDSFKSRFQAMPTFIDATLLEVIPLVVTQLET